MLSWMASVRGISMATSWWHGFLKQKISPPKSPREDYSDFQQDWFVGGEQDGICAFVCVHVSMLMCELAIAVRTNTNYKKVSNLSPHLLLLKAKNSTLAGLV